MQLVGIDQRSGAGTQTLNDDSISRISLKGVPGYLQLSVKPGDFKVLTDPLANDRYVGKMDADVVSFIPDRNSLPYGIDAVVLDNTYTKLNITYNFTTEEIVELISKKGFMEQGFDQHEQLAGDEQTYWLGYEGDFIIIPPDEEDENSIPLVLVDLSELSDSFEVNYEFLGAESESKYPVLESFKDYDFESEREAELVTELDLGKEVALEREAGEEFEHESLFDEYDVDREAETEMELEEQLDYADEVESAEPELEEEEEKVLSLDDVDGIEKLRREMDARIRQTQEALAEEPEIEEEEEEEVEVRKKDDDTLDFDF